MAYSSLSGPSSRHHLLIQFPLKNNGFNEGGNKIFRNFVKFCKIITPQTGRLPRLPPPIDASRTVLQTASPRWICPCRPLKLPTPDQILGISWAWGSWGSEPSLPGSSGLEGEEGGFWRPPGLAEAGPSPWWELLSWLHHHGAGCPHVTSF